LLNAENDTIAVFNISRGKSNEYRGSYSFYWDGVDSATITPLATDWNNRHSYSAITLTGSLYGKPFTILTSKNGNHLDAWYNETLVATLLLSGDIPSNGVLYQDDLEPRVLKALAMFTSLPLSYFR
jgi:hypothetical protein